jgi:uncharacterized protein
MNAPAKARLAAPTDDAASQAQSEEGQGHEAKAVAIKKIAARARAVCADGTNDADSVPSPCISLCRVDERTQWCNGCFRTLDEISKWSRLDAPGKRRVWQAIDLRAGQVGSALAAEAPSRSKTQ